MSELKRSTDVRSLTLGTMVRAGMRHWWLNSLAVALGVGTATAVIVGALLVGDSMRGSLRGLTVERLGKTEAAVIPGGFFEFSGIVPPGVDAAALILFESGVVEARQSDGAVRRAGSVQIVGCDPGFWDLDVSGNRPNQPLGEDSVVLNQSTASELGVEIGDQVTVRLPVEQAVPADSPLGRRDIQSEGLPRMKVVDILADRGLGRFALSPSQAAPKNIFISRQTVADVLQRQGQANALLFDRPVGREDLRIDLSDVGLTLKRVRREFPSDADPPRVIYDYYSLTSDRLLLPEVVVDRIAEQLPSSQVVAACTYLANAIEKLNQSGEVVASVPYSTITAIDSSPSLPLSYQRSAETGAADRIPVVLNSWAAQRLEASAGTHLRIAYYEPEVENGREIERFFDAVVTDVVPITKPARPYRRSRQATFDKPPTVYNDPDLTPIVPGVTDQDSISDWDLPFQLQREISREDDLYWNEHRLTPKAFLPLADGRRLFGSRFGQTTGLRISPQAADSSQALGGRLVTAIAPVLDQLGWTVQPIRGQQLSASQGTTPFDGLFLALSLFVILAAVMLIAMLFRLSLVQRMNQYGILLAVGWTPRRVAAVALGEGVLVAALGVVIGLVGGIGYAMAVLWALRSWWVGAVTVPFLTFHWTPQSLVIGVLAGWLVAALTLALTTRWLLKVDAQTLLSQRDIDSQAKRAAARRKRPLLAGAMGLAALLIAALGARAGGQAAAGGFVGGGMLLLGATLILVYARLRQPRRVSDDESVARYSLRALASRNASRHPLRSTMTIGLMASAAFLVIAISAFRLEPTEQGTGGFTLLGQTAQPLFRDLRERNVQSELLGPDADALKQTIIAPMRLRVGQDASCNNLYQATRPTVVGVPESFGAVIAESELPGFQWAAVAGRSRGESPWDALSLTATGTEQDPIPMILDQNTAMWSLQMTEGIGEKRVFEFEDGQPLTFEVVGLLSNSMLQGRLMVGESNFERMFPRISGYRFFLLADDPARSETIVSILESRLGDTGMDIADAREVLRGMLAVQNTYLRTFQSLGALGLLLGTIGLAVAQLRSVLERRKELAVMRAIGFSRGRLATVVMSETTTLLLAGIGCGAICAVLAVVPHAIVSGLRPPIIEPVGIVIGIILFGMLAGLIAVRRVARMPLVESLRSDS